MSAQLRHRYSGCQACTVSPLQHAGRWPPPCCPWSPAPLSHLSSLSEAASEAGEPPGSCLLLPLTTLTESGFKGSGGDTRKMREGGMRRGLRGQEGKEGKWQGQEGGKLGQGRTGARVLVAPCACVCA